MLRERKGTALMNVCVCVRVLCVTTALHLLGVLRGLAFFLGIG